VGGDAVRAEDQVAARLRSARVLRKLNRFDEAERTYEEAGAQAEAVGDRHSELLSRIGRAHVALGRGNLSHAESSLRQTLQNAETVLDGDAQAAAHHVMAVVLGARGQPTEAVPHVWRAFQLYEDEVSRARTLADLGAMLLIVGDPDGAERALLESVRRGGEQDFATNALIELMNCASYRRDRVGFERWRDRCQERRESMPPNILVDFVLKTAIGRARFGQVDRAETLLTNALNIAQGAGLHEFVFRIERVKAGLRDCVETPAEPVIQSEGVREVSAALAELV